MEQLRSQPHSNQEKSLDNSLGMRDQTVQPPCSYPSIFCCRSPALMVHTSRRERAYLSKIVTDRHAVAVINLCIDEVHSGQWPPGMFPGTKIHVPHSQHSHSCCARDCKRLICNRVYHRPVDMSPIEPTFRCRYHQRSAPLRSPSTLLVCT